MNSAESPEAATTLSTIAAQKVDLVGRFAIVRGGSFGFLTLNNPISNKAAEHPASAQAPTIHTQSWSTPRSQGNILADAASKKIMREHTMAHPRALSANCRLLGSGAN